MKVALVHELLTMRGGAENVLRIVADMFPDAPIYTLLYNEKKLGDVFPKERIRTSSLQPSKLNPLPSSIKYNHHLYLRRMPAAVEAWDFSEFDLVISFSSSCVHNIITNGAPKHISYINSPARYLWDRTHDVQERACTGILGPLKKKYLQHTFHKLRLWDAEASARADVLLAASSEVQKRITKYWRRESTVMTPPISDSWFSTQHGNVERERPNYFLVVSTLAAYKRIDIAIDACNKLGLHLKIVGEGPARTQLKKRAGSMIEFYGRRSNDELADLYANATAVIFPGHEDFGLVPLEAMACGTPVIALRAGGALETIVEGKTGVFFDDLSSDSLQEVLQKFDHKKYSKEDCIAQAKKFSREEFERKIQSIVHQN